MMNVYGLLGILAVLYSALVVYVAIKKPEQIWGMAKVKIFRNMLGDKGTIKFFYIWAVIFLALGIWLLTL